MIYKRFIKPLIDYTLAILGIILVSPILIVTAILIKLESPGPIIFTQQRLGLNYRVFKVYKFRSMTDKKREFDKQVFEGDPEVTKLGFYLRRLKIDELPQLFNILKGDMSLVGPRPSLPNLKDKFNEDGEFRVKVKPGVTNLAAVNGSIYLSWPERWVYDRYYVENLTFILDLEIIFKTVLVLFLGEKFFIKKHINDN
jgi:undecaprenyl phosphate N,N'-diacetylbacillosamine 1-phosphate transferase